MADIFGIWRRTWRLKNTRRELSRLTDDQLNDIGIHRGQIDDFTRSMAGGSARHNNY